MERHYTSFNSYSLEDFVGDQNFVLWVLSPTAALNSYWEKVITANPAKAEIIADARKLISNITFETQEMSSTASAELWERIAAQTSKVHQKNKHIVPLWLRGVAAAILLILGIGGTLLYYTQYQKIVVSTEFGETKSVTLPDGTIINLNANSELSYAKNWSKGKLREVWIHGEAFFKVNHLHRSGAITAAQRFIVHANQIDVEILGTSFNVNERRGSVKVALESGKISMAIASRGKPIIMRPGELAIYAENKDLIVKRRVNVIDYASWKDGVLHFNNTPVAELFKYIEDTYGYKVILSDPKIARKKLSGTFGTSNETALFKAVSKTLSVTIKLNARERELMINN